MSHRAAILASFVLSLAFPGASDAREFCRQVGNQTYCDNGQVFERSGNATYDRNGHVWQEFQNQTYGNGTLYERQGGQNYVNRDRALRQLDRQSETPQPCKLVNGFPVCH